MGDANRTEPPLTIRERLADLSNHADAFKRALDAAFWAVKDAANKEWPVADVTFTVEWRDRSETPPAGRIWASDGEGVWLINVDGRPIPPEATRVRFWTAALIPAPPRQVPEARDG